MSGCTLSPGRRCCVLPRVEGNLLFLGQLEELAGAHGLSLAASPGKAGQGWGSWSHKGVRCRRHGLCEFLAGRQEWLIGLEVFGGLQEQREQRWGQGLGRGDSERAPVRSAVAVQCSSTWVDAGATKAPQLRYLRYIWITGRRSHLQVLPPVQTEILRKRLKSEPLVWI